VKELCDAGQFYANRVLKDWRDKCRTHVEWSEAWIGTLKALQVSIP
jgi:adenylyl cyclase-associated protein